MTKSQSISYKEAGVDIEAGYEGVRLMKESVENTRIPGVLSHIGGFGGMFAPDLKDYEEPVFVSGTDGVGTKIRIAQLLDKHDTIGIDCVAMCVNDVICCGAKPLFFLDYIAIGKNEPEKVAAMVKGVADGCVEAGCALIGGETAEHPGLMKEDDYDLAGFTVGLVDRKKIISNENMRAGDVLIGLASSGFHSNGFSLVRKVFDIENADLHEVIPALGMSLGEALLVPTKIYVKPVLDVISKAEVTGISHITGGGFYENVPRMMKDGLCASINLNTIEVPAIFRVLEEKGNIPERDMYNTFNMGVGMILAVHEEDREPVLETLSHHNVKAMVIGEIIEGEEKVTLWK